MAKSDNGELNRSTFGSNTSDPNNSLLKKVTKRVSGFIPSSLTKWFGPGDGQQSVIRRRESVDDDEDPIQLQQPPKKRAKPSSDVDFSATNSFTITSTPIVNSRGDLRHVQPGPSGYTRHSTLTSTTTSANIEPTSARNEVTVANGDDKSDSGDSTSGYSSVQPQPHKESSFISDRGNPLNQPSTSKTSLNKSLNASMNSSRSLFSEQSLNPQRQCLSARRPSFSPSTFGSPSFVDRTLTTKRAVNSPFYGGRTMYGGASAYRRNRIIFPRDDSNSVTVKNSIEIKPVKDSTPNNDSVSLSKTARRILDTLEHFSTPVLDAKKIPNINRQSCDTSKATNQRRTPYTRDNKTIPNKELLVPTVPDLIKMKLKERLQDSTVKVRKVATTSKSVLNEEYSIRTVEEAMKPQKHVNKMKTKITSTRDRKEDVQDTVDTVKLPEVKLPITNLPKFDFTLPPPFTVVPKPTPVTETAKSVIPASTTKSVEPPKIISTEFSFAKPVIVSEKSKSISSVNKFTFSEPLNGKTKASTSVISATSTFTFNTSSSSTAPRRKEPTKNNGQNSIGFSLQTPAQFVSGSVMDILGKPDKKPESDNLMDKFKPAAGTWECSACMIRNNPSATRCVACETLREAPKRVEEKSCGFGNQFKMSSDKWECPACLVRNNNTDIKCAACTSPKPGATSVSSSSTFAPPTTNSFSGFGDKFKPASDTWECSACMIRNKSNALKCAACETPKPGAKSDPKPSLIMPLEVKTTGSGFGDLIKKQQSNWECPSCMVRNPPEKKTCLCCEAPKPGESQEIKIGSQATGGTKFKFGIDNSTSTGFKFGIDKTSTPTTFSFGVKPTDKTTDTKPTTSNGPAPVTTGFTFGVPAASKPETKNESPAKPAVPETSTVNNPITFGTTSAPTETNKSTTFKFSAPTTANTSSIFGSSTSTTTTAASGSSFSIPFNSAQATTHKPAFSFGAPSSVVTTSSTHAVATSTTTVVSLPSTNIFSNVISSTPSTQSGTLAFGAATTQTPAASTTSSATFSFGSPTTSKTAFGSENKLPVPQFNFGSSGLPFSPIYSSTKASATTTSTASISFGGNRTTAFSSPSSITTTKTEPPTFATPSNTSTFTFSAGSNVNNNNKTEVKPFAFSGSGETAKAPAFSFSQNETPAAAPLAKAHVFNFGTSASNANNNAPNNAAPTTNLFNFGANKTDRPASFGTGSSSVFGEPASTTATPQNGGFNFGTNSAPVNFNFGGGNNNVAPTPAVFGFGSSQAGSGSAAAAPAPTVVPGVFSFGAAAAPQQQPPAFSPDIKPNFNFTGGSLPSFTAQGTSPAPGAMVQRKIRKAVRRTQPR